MSDSVSLREVWIDSLKGLLDFSFPMKLYFTAQKNEDNFPQTFLKL